MDEYEELLEKKFNFIKQKEEIDKEIKAIEDKIEELNKEKARSIFEEIKENLRRLNKYGYDLYYDGYNKVPEWKVTEWDNRCCRIYKIN